MSEKPAHASGYPSGHLEKIRQTCLYVATKLADLADELVVVGGLVPSLLIDQNHLPPGAERHVGTLDLDFGLGLGILDASKYQAIVERLREAEFTPDRKEGKVVRQRWGFDVSKDERLTVEFLIPPSDSSDKPGSLRNLEGDFAAIITPGLQLAFLNRKRVTLEGTTILKENAKRDIWVCGAGAFIVLKALAFRNRGVNKDAYDLFYVLRNYGQGPEAVVAELKPYLRDPWAQRALEILQEDFTSPKGLGPQRAARFLEVPDEAALAADVAAFINRFLALCKGST
jgi:hypothetical protein